jgi:hypothetical protein
LDVPGELSCRYQKGALRRRANHRIGNMPTHRVNINFLHLKGARRCRTNDPFTNSNFGGTLNCSDVVNPDKRMKKETSPANVVDIGIDGP